jgi:hypothetical protein
MAKKRYHKRVWVGIGALLVILLIAALILFAEPLGISSLGAVGLVVLASILVSGVGYVGARMRTAERRAVRGAKAGFFSSRPSPIEAGCLLLADSFSPISGDRRRISSPKPS